MAGFEGKRFILHHIFILNKTKTMAGFEGKRFILHHIFI